MYSETRGVALGMCSLSRPQQDISLYGCYSCCPVDYDSFPNPEKKSSRFNNVKVLVKQRWLFLLLIQTIVPDLKKANASCSQ